MLRLSLSTALSLVLLASPVLAQTGTPAPAPASPVPAAPAPAAPAAPAQTEGAMVAPVNPDIAKIVDPNTIPALRNLLQPGTVVRYMGNEYGLKGYFVVKGDEAQIVYTTPDEQAFILGSIFSGDGVPTTFLQLGRMKQAGFDVETYINNMVDFSSGRRVNPNTQRALAEAAATAGMKAGEQQAQQAAAMSPGEQLMQAVNNASWLAFGPPSAPMLSVFMDPNCPGCHSAFQQLKPLADAGKIYLRIVPIGLMEKTSEADAINILSAANPAEAWTAKINGAETTAPAAPNPQAAAAVQGNTELFTRWNLPGTPYFVYRGADKQVKIILDMPKDLPGLLAEISAP